MADRDLEVSGFLQSITGGAQEERVRRQRRAEQTERLQQIASGSQTPLSSTLAATLGDALGKGMLRAFGVEDPDIEQARRLDQLQEYMSSLDLTTEQGNMQIADVYRQMGDYDKASDYINKAKGIASERAALGQVKEPTEGQIKRVAAQIKSRLIAEKDSGFLGFNGTEGVDEDFLEEMATNIAYEIEQRKAEARVAGRTNLTDRDFLMAAVDKFTNPKLEDGSANPYQIYDFEINEEGRLAKFNGYRPGVGNRFYNERRAIQDKIDDVTRMQQEIVKEESALNKDFPSAVPTTRKERRGMEKTGPGLLDLFSPPSGRELRGRNRRNQR